MRKTHGLAYALFMLAVMGCAASTSRPMEPAAVTPSDGVKSEKGEQASGVFVNIPSVVGLSAKEMDKKLGKPTYITKITRYPEQMPGKFRTYKIQGKDDALMIRFYRDRAIKFTFSLPSSFDTPEQALLSAGIDVRGTPPDITASHARRWKEKVFNGVAFVDVAAVKDFQDASKYGMVSAEIR